MATANVEPALEAKSDFQQPSTETVLRPREAKQGLVADPTDDSARFLLCVDPHDDEASERAVKFLEHRLIKPGDEIVVLSVVPVPALAPTHHPEAVNTPAVEWYHKELIKQHDGLQSTTLKRLDEIADEFPAGVHVQTRLAYGNVVAGIEQACVDHKCDVVVVGRRRMSKAKRWLTAGSVSSAILLNTDCTVLVAR